MGLSVDLLEVLAAAAGGGAAGWIAHHLWTRRRTAIPSPSNGPPTPSVSTSASRADDPRTTGPAQPTIAQVGAAPPGSANGSPPARPVTTDEGLGLARRVILHLSGLGRLGHDDVARVGFTQQGMAAALSARQGSLVRVLQRLEAADVLTVDRRHVSGMARRLKVYRLTALGESVARDLRHPTDGAPPRIDRPSPSEPTRASSTGEWVVRRNPGEVRRP